MRRRADERSMEERFLRSGAVQPEDEPRRRHPRTEFLLTDLKRFAIFTVGAGALAAGLGLLAGWLTDGDLLRYTTLGLYAGGALLVLYRPHIHEPAHPVGGRIR